MFEDVAVEHVELLALEVMGEIYEPLYGLSWPDQHSVLPSQVGHQPAFLVHHEVRDLLGSADSLQDPELEPVDVHRMRHAFLIVMNLPDLLCAPLNHDGKLVHLVGLSVDEPLHSPIVGGHRDSYGSSNRSTHVQLWHRGKRFRHAS